VNVLQPVITTTVHITACSLQGDESRAVFKFTPLIAPVKATVFPLVQKQQLNEQAAVLSKELTAAGLSNIIDTTGAKHTWCTLIFGPSDYLCSMVVRGTQLPAEL